jgi:hypothetical protein
VALGGGGGGGGSARGIEAGRAFVRLGAKDDLTAHLKKIGGAFAEFGKKALAVTGIGGAVAGVIGGLSFKETADDLSKMNDVAKAFGAASERGVSGLFGVLNAAGGEFKENLEGVIQFSGTVEKAVQGVGQGKELFDGLKVSAQDVAKLPIEEQFYSVLSAIRDMPQPLQESKLALIGGTDSMKQWQKLLSMSSDEVQEIAKRTAFGRQELEDAAAASKAMGAAQAALNRGWQQAVVILSPLVASLATMGADALKPVAEFLKNRSLGDLWEEALIRLKQGGSEAAMFLQGTFSGIWDFFASGWDSAVLVVKNLFADLAEFIGRTMRQAVTGALEGPLALLGKVDAGAAAGAAGGAELRRRRAGRNGRPHPQAGTGRVRRQRGRPQEGEGRAGGRQRRRAEGV